MNTLTLRTTPILIFLCLFIGSCSKEGNLAGVANNNTNTNLYQYYQTKIAATRANNKTKQNSPVALSHWWSVACSDAGGAVSGFKYSVGFVGPGYGAAIGFLSGLFCSTMTYAEATGQLIPVPTTGGDPFVTSYVDFASHVGYEHNRQLLNLIIAMNGSYTNSDDLVDEYFDQMCDSAANAFGVTASNLNTTTFKSGIKSMLQSASGLESISDYTTLLQSEGVDQDVITLFGDFVTDAEGQSASQVDSFVVNYTGLATNHPSLSSSNKTCIINGFQVYRYSSSFWRSNLM